MLRLYKCTSSIAVGKSIILGSSGSRHGNCSKIFVHDTLYEMDCLVQVTIMVMEAASDNVITVG